MRIFPSAGGAPYRKDSLKIIRLILKGCANRPFYHISIMEAVKEPKDPVIEQIGSYDPLPNQFNEKLVAINFEKLEHWLREGAVPSRSVKKLLGLSGYFPIYPGTFEDAWKNRKKINETLKELQNTVSDLQKNNPESTIPSTSSSSSNNETLET